MGNSLMLGRYEKSLPEVNEKELAVIATDKQGRTRVYPNYHPHKLVGGNLTADGVQWSTEVEITSIDSNNPTPIFTITLDDGSIGELGQIVAGLTWAWKSGGVDDTVSVKAQARNKAGTWTDISAYISRATWVIATYYDASLSGNRISGVTNLDTYPIDVRLVGYKTQGGAGLETAHAKVKSSSHLDIYTKA